MKNKKGFTLVELLVVIAIIGILATLAIVSLNSARTRSRDSRRVADLRSLQTTLELYYDENNSRYPDTANNANSWTNLGGTAALGTYLQGNIPTDPNAAAGTREYFYVSGGDYYLLGARTLENTDSSSYDSAITSATADVTSDATDEAIIYSDGTANGTATGGVQNCSGTAGTTPRIYCVGNPYSS